MGREGGCVYRRDSASYPPFIHKSAALIAVLYIDVSFRI